MVQVREDIRKTAQGSIDLQAWVNSIQALNPRLTAQRLRSAVDFVAMHNQAEPDDEHWSDDYDRLHCSLEIASILAELHLDDDAMVAAILYRSLRDKAASLDTLEAEFGSAVTQLLRGVLQMAKFAQIDDGNKMLLGRPHTQSEQIRKMLVAIIDDARVAFIKLAERSIALRCVKNNDAIRERVAREVAEIYAPLAHRLGIAHIKWELEDLSFRYLHPGDYKRIAKQLSERRQERDEYIERTRAQLGEALNDTTINADIQGRAKHIYSIWRKMQNKQLDFTQVLDIRAFRILVDDIRECYTVLGIVHTLWKAIPQEFDDYIALPKENGYRSLHTAVIGPEAKVVEIQIRTREMHDEAEFGICAHWRYKKADNATTTSAYEEKIARLQQSIRDANDSDGVAGFSDDLSNAITQDAIYVFTPDGHVVELSQGATPLDFAYRVHTEVGHRCRGAKVNGRIVPLTYALQTGQQIEILTSAKAEPSRDWLRSSQGYLNTSRARAKVRHWFKQRDRDQNIQSGRSLLEREFKRLALPKADIENIVDALEYKSSDEMLAALGAGDIGAGSLIKTAQALHEPDIDQQQYQVLRPPPKRDDNASDIDVSGTGNMLTHIANCCKPVPGEPIVGYVTQGRGVSIHREDCAQLLNLEKTEPERLISVNWGGEPSDTYPVDVAIHAYDRPGLLRDVTALLANENVNVLAVNTQSNRSDSTAAMRLTIEVSSIEWLGRLLARITQLPNIIDAKRAHN